MSILLVTTQASAGSSTGNLLLLVGQVVLIGAIFYFLLIRPQQRRAKAHQDKIDGVQKNDQVVTGGGLMGKAVKVTEDYVEVEIASGVKVKAVKSTLADIVPKNVKAAND